MKKILLGVLLVLMIVSLSGCGLNLTHTFGLGSFVFSKDGYICQNFQSVQKTEFLPASEYVPEQTVFTSEEGIPLKLYGIHQFEPGWYLRDTYWGGAGVAGPWETEEACNKEAEDAPVQWIWPYSRMERDN